ncbi:hypothetical protein FYJ75_03425 [Roseburia sp. MUC/MUC-530-WT-4D]|uniref:ParB/Sulfiredoxin domain-containing protein n=1 Tax=Roseburia porci TaxID=2605790 RepID=A0A6L5YP80_9FIRM|nr:hypothetical protein [Roseburia porci]MST74088.1 hypothetical protein [Roseburia porci]
MNKEETIRTEEINERKIAPEKIEEMVKSAAYDYKENYIKESKGYNAYTAVITPEMAETFLQNNINNRKLSANHVKGYEDLMKKGKWTLGNDAICFRADGVLINGQHRLAAIRECGIPQVCIIALNAETNPNMDRGKGRSDADNLRMEGKVMDELCATKTTGMVNFLRKVMHDPTYTNSTTASGTEDFLVEFQDKISEMYEKVGTSASKGSLYSNAPVRAAFFIAYVNGVPCDVLLEMREALNGQGTYISTAFSQERLLPAYYLMKALRDKDKGRMEAFLRTLYAIDCVNRNLKRKSNKPMDNMIYDFTFKGKSLKEIMKESKKAEK